MGVLAVDSMTPNVYTSEHARRLLAFTAQAAIALENAQLFEQTQQRVRELALLYDSSLAITSTLDKSAVLHSVTERMARAVDATSTYIVWCDWERDTGTIIAEYFSPQANAQERLSDLGEVHRLSDYPRTLAAMRGQSPFDHESEPGRCRSGCHLTTCCAIRRQEQPARTAEHGQSNAGLRRHLGQPC